MMSIPCEYCDTTLDPLTGKCSFCDDLTSTEPLPGFLTEEYIEEDLDPMLDPIVDDLE